jgi:putative restriction endonuclease
VPDDFDERLRAAAFVYLSDVSARLGGPVTRGDIGTFSFEGHPMALMPVQRGILKPRQLQAALSIVTVFRARPDQRPYDDAEGDDGYMRYKWRGVDADFYDNKALRIAMQQGKPLIWFLGVAPSYYRPLCPVWLVGEEPAEHQFVVALDDVMRSQWSTDLQGAGPFDPSRRYADLIVKARLHQRVFRDRVLVAYQSQCALCRLRHARLLDAAHIKEDSDGGEPIVPNGIAMCAIHHRAFDAQVLGLRPDYRIEIRSDVLHEHDGPTLQYALQELHGKPFALPRHRAERPRSDLLEERYEQFRAAV